MKRIAAIGALLVVLAGCGASPSFDVKPHDKLPKTQTLFGAMSIKCFDISVHVHLKGTAKDRDYLKLGTFCKKPARRGGSGVSPTAGGKMSGELHEHVTQHTSPIALWERADREHPSDVDARRARYLDLMREHGHIIDREVPLCQSTDNYYGCMLDAGHDGDHEARSGCISAHRWAARGSTEGPQPEATK